MIENIILPINITAYANELAYYSSKVENLGFNVDLSILNEKIAKILDATTAIDSEIASVQESLQTRHCRGKFKKLMKKIKKINGKLAGFEGGEHTGNNSGDELTLY